VLALDDSELTALLDAARPIPRHARDRFLQDVASELAKYPETGVGVVSRVASRLQKQYLHGPRDLRHEPGGKWR
jgi:hypothetical protein